MSSVGDLVVALALAAFGDLPPFTRLGDEALFSGWTAMVTCVEYVDSGPTTGKIVATNVFQKEDGQWKIVHHHGSSSAPPLEENPWTI